MSYLYSLRYGVQRYKTKTTALLSALLLSFTGIGVAAAPLMVASAVPTTSTVVVTPADLDNTSSNPAVVRADGMNKWFMYNDTNDTVDNTLGSFVTGPGTPPQRSGSIQFTLGTTPLNRKNIATYQFAGTPLASITTMTFSTYSHSGVAGPNESPFLNFNVDFSGSGTTFQRRLVYVPSANAVSVPQDSWNTYDTINGGNALWTWSGYSGNGNKWPDNNTSQYRTLSAIKTAWPNIRVLPTDSWLGIRVGEPGPTGYTANVNSFTLGTATNTTTYVFEPSIGPPTSDEQCENNGWKNFNNPTFKSQKECEDFVEADANGNLHMSNPSQKIIFNVANESDKKNKNGKVEYWNFDYPGGLHYKTIATCSFVNPNTKEARFLFQIPKGHPGLSGVYVVAYVKELDQKNTPDLYGHAATSDLNTATQWCQTGVGFAPQMYTVTKGHVEVD